MPVFSDQLKREINLSSVPKRIISLVPSQTELLFYLGLDDEIIGITKFCIHPTDKFKLTQKIGGTKQLNIEKIKALEPDLIIANKEENERNHVEELMQHFPVWISDINDLDSAIDMIERVGALVGKESMANVLSNDIKQRFNAIGLPSSNLKVAYFIWRKPYMVAGKGTFIDDMLQKCGLMNAIEQDRYPEITTATLTELQPDAVLLSSEPYPFKEKHIEEIRLILPGAIVELVDGEMFSWYGSRLLEAPEYFGQLAKRLAV